jgi:hypothetical protein
MTFSLPAAGDIAPSRVLVAGDWHGNRYWALNVIHRLPQLLAGEQRRLIVHLGDFGIWPDDEGRRYLIAVSAALGQVRAVGSPMRRAGRRRTSRSQPGAPDSNAW